MSTLHITLVLHLNLEKFRNMLYYYLFKLLLILYILHRKKKKYNLYKKLFNKIY